MSRTLATFVLLLASGIGCEPAGSNVSDPAPAQTAGTTPDDVEGKGEGEEKNEIPAEALAILRSAKSFELLSLSPGDVADADEEEEGAEQSVESEDSEEETSSGYFYNTELGRTPVRAKDRNPLLDYLQTSAKDWEGGGVDCFYPRHGIHAESSGRVVDLVICFECEAFEVYVDQQRVTTVFMSERMRSSAIFDALLQAANIKLAPKAIE